MKNQFALLLFLGIFSPAHGQLTFSNVLDPTLGYHPDRWEIMSDGQGQFYLKEWDDYYNPQFNHYLMHSGDGGLHWAMVSNQAGRRYFPGLDGKVYALEAQNLLRSEDNGANYQAIASNVPNGRNLVVRENGQMLMSDNTGVYRSDNQGQSWEKVADAQNLHLKILPGHAGTWGWTTANNELHFWHSSALGENWVKLYSTPVAYYNKIRTTLIPSPDGMLYFNVGGDYNRVLRSSDGGSSWEEKAVKPGAPAQVVSLAALPSGEVLARVNDNLWYRSLNKGLSWEVFHPNWEFEVKHAISTFEGAVFSSGRRVLNAWNDNTDSWDFSCFGLLTPSRFYMPDENRIQMLVGGGLYEWQSNNEAFIPVKEPPSNSSCSQRFLDNEGGYYLDLCSEALLRSTDFGEHYDTIFKRAFQVTPLESLTGFVKNGDEIKLLTHDNLYRSSDGGQSWAHNAPLAAFHTFSRMSIAQDGRIYITDGNKIWRSDDGGINLELVFGECCFSTLQASGQNVYAMHDKEMWVSTDHGEHWGAWGNDPLEGTWAYDLNEIKNFWVAPDQQVFAGGIWQGTGTLFYSPDHGQNWERYPVGPGNCYIDFLGKDNRLYVHLSGSIVFPYTLLRSEQTIQIGNPSSDSEALSKPLKLFPNPVEDVLYFDGTREQSLSALVFNQLGQTMRAHHDVSTREGIDVSQLPPGTYYVQLSSNSHTWQGKFIKTKR